MDYVGLKWYKCDFHLHTMSSPCYKNKSDTIEQWLDEVRKKGLNCIAVTDHNDYRNIDPIMEQASSMGITVFPGVEVTCDTCKIHVLILFDTDKNSDDVRDFLASIGIKKPEVESGEGTDTRLLDVCKIAKDNGCIVIPAHIDEPASISKMSDASMKELFSGSYVDAVQITKPDIWKYKTEDQQIMMQEKYGEDISNEILVEWRATYNKAKEARLPMIMASDNPSKDDKLKHGLWGIGCNYTWIKMGDNPNLESLRQAFLAPEERIRHCVESSNIPERLPDMWLKSISFNGLTINPVEEVSVGFNPQLNSIIGGRGSGKSSLVRILIGLSRSCNFDDLKEIKDEQDNFYKIKGNTKFGVFKEGSEVTAEIYKNDILYKISESFGKKNSNGLVIKKYDSETDNWSDVDPGYIVKLGFDAYTQKQIYELAQSSDALSDLIDKNNTKLVSLKEEANNCHVRLTQKVKEIREANERINTEKDIVLDLTEINDQIELYKKSGITDAVVNKQKFDNTNNEINEYLDKIRNIGIELGEWSNEQSVEEPSDDLPNEIKIILSSGKVKLDEHIQKAKQTSEEIIKLHSDYLQMVESTQWKNDFNEAQSNYIIAKNNLDQHSLSKDKLDELLNLQKQKNAELDAINVMKNNIANMKKEHKLLEDKYKAALTKIRECRTEYVSHILEHNNDIVIEYVKYKNKKSIEDILLRFIPRASNTLFDDIIKFSEKAVDDFKIFRETIIKIINDEDVKFLSGYFKKAIKGLDPSILDQLFSFVPEDELQVKYRSSSGRLVPLVTASAGQKTTAILAFILAYGDKPLILDQPEDDLDNKLVYDLVVRQLKESKKQRQIIVVTHNANIPVNGDSEYIISMDSISRYIKPGLLGTIDDKDIRDEICNVMEGTEDAFEMRAKKYHLDNRI